MRSSNPIVEALKAVFDNNWFYVACIELWGIYVHLPRLFPAALVRLPMYIYLPLLFVFCYVIFFIVELIRIEKRAGGGEYDEGTDFVQEEERSVSRKDFMDALARSLTSKLSWLIAALCAIPPFWLADYYYGRYSSGIVVKGAVMLISFALVFAFMAHEKAKRK